ncbi:hypothetical protein PG994_000619 [Apiospora phragmitis]|uniref:Uncharacterized protein n=1 Tax=Apiospora phragmitis TaxID=2905665 RepID=A0ABR1X700_9PEZI
MFLRLPPAAAVFLLSTVLGELADGHALLPRQTKTIEPHELNVVMWPPLPTAAPLMSPLELLRRQADNTICGYLGGDSGLPATCSAGSHCVLDEANKVMGCCPNSGSCTTGVFTGCVDQNSGPQTELNPYVYTCTGSNVCYKNSFPSGFFQYGCGTASDLATSVQTGASGKPTLPLVQTSIALTKPASSFSQSTSRTSSSQSASSSSSSSVNFKLFASLLELGNINNFRELVGHADLFPHPSRHGQLLASCPSDISAARPRVQPHRRHCGGTIGGLAFLAALLALLFCCMRRRRNRRLGPGPAPVAAPTSEYANPVRNHGAAFAPLPTWQEEEEPQPTPPTHHTHPYYQYEHPATRHVAGGDGGGYGAPAPVSAVSGPSPNTPNGGGGGGWPLAYSAAHAAGAGQGRAPRTPIANEYLNNNYNSNYNNNGSATGPTRAHNYDMYHHGNNNSNGLLRKVDDLSRDAPATMRHVQDDEDTEPLTASSSMHNYPMNDGSTTGGGGGNNANMLQPYQQRPPAPGSSGSMTSTSSYTPSRRGDRPLWQQTRRQSRNLMWL